MLGKIFIVFVRLYQICISPLFAPCCRFYPSCSEYAVDAIRRHGPFKGPFLGIMRLLRCHPFQPGGYDPVK
ncbi:MAG TPA: membrane protein insertion efficiency factor YidD [Syntrophales bacterium]|nr:membrane protein insertion efficiency factor YidD [Syntrophales bacterium]